MANVTQESIELALQLWALYAEARGYIAEASITWNDLTPVEREAWVQVAQFVIAYRNRPSWMTEEQVKESNELYKRLGYGIPDHK